MRVALALCLAMSCAATLVVACSSSDSSTSIPNSGTDGSTVGPDPDAGGGGNPDGTAPDPDSSMGKPDGTAGAFALTSSAFTEGGNIPDVSSCNGANDSPPLTWTAGPATTKSYALVLTDKSNGLIHAVLYDIPGSTTVLPAKMQAAYAPTVPIGAHWTTNYKGQFGYAGPCPQTEHTYEFALYALDVATLPGASMTLTRANAEAAILMHDVGTAKLTAKYKP